VGHPEAITDARGTHLRLHRVRRSDEGVRADVPLYDVYRSEAACDAGTGWIGIIDVHADGFRASHFALLNGAELLGAHATLEDATLLLRVWDDILTEQGFWNETDRELEHTA